MKRNDGGFDKNSLKSDTDEIQIDTTTQVDLPQMNDVRQIQRDLDNMLLRNTNPSDRENLLGREISSLENDVDVCEEIRNHLINNDIIDLESQKSIEIETKEIGHLVKALNAQNNVIKENNNIFQTNLKEIQDKTEEVKEMLEDLSLKTQNIISKPEVKDIVDQIIVKNTWHTGISITLTLIALGTVLYMMFKNQKENKDENNKINEIIKILKESEIKQEEKINELLKNIKNKNDNINIKDIVIFLSGIGSAALIKIIRIISKIIK